MKCLISLLGGFLGAPFWLLLVMVAPAAGQTYYGVLTTPANSGPGGSCCLSVATVDASGQPVPGDGSCVGCSVITQTQYNAYITASRATGSAKQAVSKAMADGIQLTGCTTYANLNNSHFAVTDAMIAYLTSLRGVFKTNGVPFPNATAVPSIVDLNGTGHLIASLAEFTALDNIVSGYHWALQSHLSKVIAGQSSAMPPTTSSSYGPC